MPRISQALYFIAGKSANWGEECYALPEPQDYIYLGSSGRKPSWVACRYAHGEPEKGQVAINECGAADCVNGSHWRWGTWKEAMDRREFPSRKGGKNPNARLTELEVSQLRSVNWGRGTYKRAAAEAAGISISTLHAILNGWVWKGVEPYKSGQKNGDEF